MYTLPNGDLVIEVTNGYLQTVGNGVVGIVLHPTSFDIIATGARGFVVRFRENEAGERMRTQYNSDGVYIDVHGAVFAWSDPAKLLTRSFSGGGDGAVESVEDSGGEVRSGAASGGGESDRPSAE